ncbi:MAG: abortive infection family protein [Patescibacteria group bacterium]|nr:abortive infection family protein [Patescibacteria group bacterium]MDD4444095.1 abortive infection family protein [Patescibacteria group bacterium]
MKIKNKKIIILSKVEDVIKIKNENKIESEFSKEQIIKCEEKILSGDYDGAITNARSLLEDVVKNLYKKVTGKELISKGDLSKDYSELKKELNLSENTNVDSSIKQIISGLTSVINGLAAVRNKMGDGHSRETKPQKHHAKLVVNCAKTFVGFLYDTVDYQNK